MSWCTAISIIDYGIGNIRSVQNALNYLGIESRLVETPEQILDSEKLILPGVGSFRAAMEAIRQRGILGALNKAVLQNRVPVLGICLGMQLLAEESEEDGLTKGLGWIQGSVKRFPAEKLFIKVPHVGFNTVTFEQENNNLFEGLGKSADFYFVHSYRMICKNKEDVSGWAYYGEKFVASVQRKNIFGTQFHPEKSQSNGLTVLKNFCELQENPPPPPDRTVKEEPSPRRSLRPRLIFTLLMRDGKYMLSRNFNLQEVGDLSWVKKYYNFDAIAFSIDELIVLNVERGEKNVERFSKNLIELNKECFMPIAAGGGIRTMEHARILLNSGADKLVVNTPLIEDPELIRLLVKTYGSQCVVASIDYKKTDDETEVFIEDGTRSTGKTVEESLKNAQDLGCGEIYLNSMDQDGTGYGYDLETVNQVVEKSKIPVIIAGGAGKYEHFAQGVLDGKANAAATANLFNFIADGLTEARKCMVEKGIETASWDFGYHNISRLRREQILHSSHPH